MIKEKKDPQKKDITPIVSKTVAVLFVDLVGYTTKTSSLKRSDFNELHNQFDELVLPITKKYSGEMINKIGDAFLITFKSPTDTLLCSIELQNNFKRYNLNQTKENKLFIRVAIDYGEVLVRNNGCVYGETVNLAARIEGITPPNQIYFSDALARIMNPNEINFTEIGYHDFKGIPHPVRVFRVVYDWEKTEKMKEMIKEATITILIIATCIFLFKQFVWDTELVSAAVAEIAKLTK